MSRMTLDVPLDKQCLGVCLVIVVAGSDVKWRAAIDCPRIDMTRRLCDQQGGQFRVHRAIAGLIIKISKKET